MYIPQLIIHRFELFGGYRDSKWFPLRKQFLIDNPICFGCCTALELEVHHIVPVGVDPSLELVISNLLTLCHVCHFRIGHSFNWRFYNPYVIEDCKLQRKRIVERMKI